MSLGSLQLHQDVSHQANRKTSRGQLLINKCIHNSDSCYSWVRVSSTSSFSLQWWHIWDLHNHVPWSKSTATLIVSLSMWRLREDNGVTLSHTTDSLMTDAHSRVWGLESGEISKRLLVKDVALILSPTERCQASPSGGGWLCPSAHMASASSRFGNGRQHNYEAQ